jgi:serine/threonine-protein kinase
MMAHLQAAPPRVTELKPFLPAGFDEVIAYAMAKDPGMRFQRAADLAHAAQAALVDTTASVRVPMLPVPSADVNSYPADFAQTAAPAWWQQSGPPTMAAPPKPRRRRGRRLAVIGAVAALVARGRALPRCWRRAVMKELRVQRISPSRRRVGRRPRR